MPVLLNKQDIFESLWAGYSPHPDRWLILFSSQRCAPCERLNKSVIEEAARAAGYTFYICDATVNRYTPVYCDITRYPTFQLMEPGKVIASLTSSDTATVVQWIKDHANSS